MTRPPRLCRTLVWAGAAIAVFAAHAGAVALVLRETPMQLASDGPPPAFMIDLAPLPETASVDDTQIGEQEQNVQEVEEQPEPEPEEVAEPEPEPEPEEPQEDLAEVEDAAVPIATARPRPRPERDIRREVRRDVPRQQQQPRREAPQKQQTRAASQAPQGTRNAAPQAGAGRAASPAETARWQSRLISHLERRKRYPSAARARREQGTVHVRFSIDERGNVLGVALARSSGFPELDQAVLQLVQRASPVPAPPPGASRNITAPINFAIR